MMFYPSARDGLPLTNADIFIHKGVLIKLGALFLNQTEGRPWAQRSQSRVGKERSLEVKWQSWKILDIVLSLWWCCHDRAPGIVSADYFLSFVLSLEASWQRFTVQFTSLQFQSWSQEKRKGKAKKCWMLCGKLSRTRKKKGIQVKITSFWIPLWGENSLYQRYCWIKGFILKKSQTPAGFYCK